MKKIGETVIFPFNFCKRLVWFLIFYVLLDFMDFIQTNISLYVLLDNNMQN